MLVIECKYSLDVQVASSEWVLGVQIKHFKNLYNVEIRDGLYCCCDNPNMTLCSESVTHEDGKCFDSDPVRSCKPYYILHIMVCSHNQTCSVPKTDRFRLDNSSAFDQLLLTIPLMETELSNEVRIKLVQNQLLNLSCQCVK